MQSLLRLNLAYGCYAWIALVLIAVTVFEIMPLELSTYQVLGMVVGIPVVMATLVIALAGLVLTALTWREWPLVLMAALTLTFPVLLSLQTETYLLQNVVWPVGLALILAFFSIRWFGWRRRRQ